MPITTWLKNGTNQFASANRPKPVFAQQTREARGRGYNRGRAPRNKKKAAFARSPSRLSIEFNYSPNTAFMVCTLLLLFVPFNTVLKLAAVIVTVPSDVV